MTRAAKKVAFVVFRRLCLMLKIYFVLSVFVFSVFETAKAQDSLVLLKTIPSVGLDKASQDNYGHLYISDKKGNINKYDTLGTFLLNFSPQKIGNVTLLEAANTIKIFVFYRDFQEYTMLERFLGPQPNSALNEEQIGFARLATFASDYNLWVIDETDFALKKYDRQFNKVLYKTSLDLILDPQDYDVSFLREYQNNLYISDRNSGILVFDAFGSYKKKIPFKGVDFFAFHEDELYYLQKNTVYFFHLYLLSSREIALPLGRKYSRVFVHNRKLYAIRPEGIDIYQLLKK